MKNIGHKLLATMMTLTFLTVSTVPAFAETTTPPSQIETSDKVKLTPEEVKARLLDRIKKIQDGREDMAPILALRTTEKATRSQLREARKTIHQGLKVVRENKDKDTLIKALESLVIVQDHLVLVKGTATILKADHEQLKTDRKAKNSEVIAADLTKIEADLKLLIEQQKQVLTDLNETIAILSQSTPQENTSSSDQV